MPAKPPLLKRVLSSGRLSLWRDGRPLRGRMAAGPPLPLDQGQPSRVTPTVTVPSVRDPLTR